LSPKDQFAIKIKVAKSVGSYQKPIMRKQFRGKEQIKNNNKQK
jgi:hypothetical protein